MRREGFSSAAVKLDRSLDIRYSGQSYELNVPFSGDFISAFHHAHEKRYGYFDAARICEVVTIRARFAGRTPNPVLPKLKQGGSDSSAARVSTARVSIHGRLKRTPIYSRSALLAGNRISGPAVVTEYSATTFIPPDWRGRVDPDGNLILEPRQ
jgi:N-methylhydantoinase A